MATQSPSPTCAACGNLNEQSRTHCFRCGQPVGGASDSLPSGSAVRQSVEGTTLLPGTQLGQGRYEIDCLLGEGGMGAVYRATDVSLERTVALKLLHPELLGHSTARRRMVQEARILAGIEHPNVVQVRNVFEEGEVLAMELEFMPGGDLLGAIPAGGMGEKEAVELMTSVLSGLHAIHEAGLVHRDVKPENVLLNAESVPKVTDLGVAHDPSAREKTRGGAVLGTLEYMSPEQIQGKTVDRRADLYAAGIVLYRMLTGTLPFEASSDFDWQVAHVRDAPKLDALRSKASNELVAVVERALAKAPGERWQTAQEMAAGLEGADGNVKRAGSPPPTASPGRSVSKNQGTLLLSTVHTVPAPSASQSPTNIARRVSVPARGGTVPAKGRLRAGARMVFWGAMLLLSCIVLFMKVDKGQFVGVSLAATALFAFNFVRTVSQFRRLH